MIDYGKYRSIKVERENRLATVTLNRPEALNAVNSELHDDAAASAARPADRAGSGSSWSTDLAVRS